MQRVMAVARATMRRCVCALWGHEPTRLGADKERCLRYLPTRRCVRCGEWVPR